MKYILKLLALVVSDIFQKDHFDSELGDGSDSVNAIWNRPEVANDVISCHDMDTFYSYIFEKTLPL